jgi:tRNA (uracil-5-)-methyltransferase TRM9
MSSNKVTAIDIPPDTNPQAHEDEHVHAVYEQIASHFSSTRYKVFTHPSRETDKLTQQKPWPIIAKFLSSIPPGHIGLDSGTGNGKYLPLPGPSSPMIGLDRSRNLLQIARHAGSQSTVDSGSVPTTVNEVVQADVLNECWRAGVFVRFPSVLQVSPYSTS